VVSDSGNQSAAEVLEQLAAVLESRKQADPQS